MIYLPEPPKPAHITLLALNLRFTRAERDAIRAAEMSDPDVSDIMYLMRQASYISLTDPTTIQGLQALELKGLLGVGRADVILNQQVQDSERP